MTSAFTGDSLLWTPVSNFPSEVLCALISSFSNGRKPVRGGTVDPPESTLHQIGGRSQEELPSDIKDQANQPPPCLAHDTSVP